MPQEGLNILRTKQGVVSNGWFIPGVCGAHQIHIMFGIPLFIYLFILLIVLDGGFMPPSFCWSWIFGLHICFQNEKKRREGGYTDHMLVHTLLLQSG